MSGLLGCANQCIIGKMCLRSILSRRLLGASDDRPLSSLQAVCKSTAVKIDLHRLPGHCDWFIWCMHCCRLLAASVHRQGGSIYIYKPQMYCLMWCTVFRIDCQATVLDSQTDVLPHDMQCINTWHSSPGKVLALCLIHRMYALLPRMHACTLLTATVDRQYSSLQAIGTLNWIHWLL